MGRSVYNVGASRDRILGFITAIATSAAGRIIKQENIWKVLMGFCTGHDIGWKSTSGRWRDGKVRNTSPNNSCFLRPRYYVGSDIERDPPKIPGRVLRFSLLASM